MRSTVVELFAERIHYARVRETDAFSRWLGRAATPGGSEEQDAWLEWQHQSSVLRRLMELLHAEVQERTTASLLHKKPVTTEPSGQHGPKAAEGVGEAGRAEQARVAPKGEFH